MKGKGAGAANVCYLKFSQFFEKKHILEGMERSKKRLEVERIHGPGGYSLRHDNGKRLVFRRAPVDHVILDIDAVAARRANWQQRM